MRPTTSGPSPPRARLRQQRWSSCSPATRSTGSCPYLRCTQTVAPLAAARGLAVEPSDDLAEGAGQAGVALATRLVHEPAFTVLCSHGDVVEEVLDALGVQRDSYTRKGATWVIEEAGARHLPAP